MTIQFPSTKATKDAIRDVIGQTVTFTFEGIPTACPVCSGLDNYDPVNESSLDPFCSICSGLYWITADTTSDITAHVRWRTADQPNMDVAGQTYEGDCSITIDIDDIPEANIVKIKNILADSRLVQVYRVIPRGIPTRDRLRFVCREYGKE